MGDEGIVELEQELSALWQRARVGTREAARSLHPRLDPSSYPVLAVLRRRGPLRMSELGSMLLHDKSTLSRQIDALVRLGLAERTVDPVDARARLVSLTVEGRERMEALHAERRVSWRAGLAGWEEGEVEELSRLLRKFGETGLT